MKITFMLRDTASLVIEANGEEAAGIEIQVLAALSAEPMGTVRISYADGSVILIPAQHIQIMKIEP